jgi:hypothetical protein
MRPFHIRAGRPLRLPRWPGLFEKRPRQSPRRRLSQLLPVELALLHAKVEQTSREETGESGAKRSGPRRWWLVY